LQNYTTVSRLSQIYVGAVSIGSAHAQIDRLILRTRVDDFRSVHHVTNLTAPLRRLYTELSRWAKKKRC